MRPTAEELLSHAGFLRGLARGLLADEHAADDVVQETYLAALRRPPAKGNVRAWLGRVAKNLALTARRGARRREARERRAARPEAVPAAGDAVAHLELQRKVVDLVLALDEPYRTAIVERYFHERTPQEIARRLAVPLQTAKTRLKRGLQQLRARLDADHGGDRRAWSAPLLALLALPARAFPLAGAVVAALLLLGGGIAVWSLALRKGEPERVTRGAEARRAPAAEEAQAPIATEGKIPAPAPPSVRGKVTDRTGRPVAHIPVRYSLNPKEPGTQYILSEAYTDAAGEYAIRDLPPGKLWMTLLSEMNFGPELEFETAFRTPVVHDFVVQGTLELSGRVVLAKPDAVEFWLDFREEMGGGGWGNVFEVRKVTLPPDGAFHLAGLRPGTYTLRAKSERHEWLERRLYVHRSVRDFRLVLAEGCVLEGKVAVPEPGRTDLWIHPSGRESWTRRFECDQEGAFRIPNLKRGKYVIFLRHTIGRSGNARSLEREYAVEVKEAEQQLALEVTPDEKVFLKVRPAVAVLVFREGDKQVVLDGGRLHGLPQGTYRLRIEALGYHPEERTVTVAGEARLEVDLRPRPGQRITAAIESEYWRVEARRDGVPDGWRLVLWRDGRIRISHTPTPGVGRAFLEPGHYVFRASSSRFVEAETGSVEIKESGPDVALQFGLERGATIHGRVLTATGVGVNDVLVHLFRGEKDGAFVSLPVKEAVVEEEGRYRIAGLRPGRYRLALTEEGEPALKDVQVGAADVEVILRLEG